MNNEIKTLAEVEKNHILSIIESNKNLSLEQIARKLGIGKTTLYRKLKEYKNE